MLDGSQPSDYFQPDLGDSSVVGSTYESGFTGRSVGSGRSSANSAPCGAGAPGLGAFGSAQTDAAPSLPRLPDTALVKELINRFKIEGGDREFDRVDTNLGPAAKYFLCSARVVTGEHEVRELLFGAVPSATEPRLYRAGLDVSVGSSPFIDQAFAAFGRLPIESFEVWFNSQARGREIRPTQSVETAALGGTSTGHAARTDNDFFRATPEPAVTEQAFLSVTGAEINVLSDPDGYFVTIKSPGGDDTEMIALRFKNSENWRSSEAIGNLVRNLANVGSRSERERLVNDLVETTHRASLYRGEKPVSETSALLETVLRRDYGSTFRIEQRDGDDTNLCLRVLEGRGNLLLTFSSPPLVSGHWTKAYVSVGDRLGKLVLCCGDGKDTLGKVTYDFDLSALSESRRAGWTSAMVESLAQSAEAFPGPIIRFMADANEQTGMVSAPRTDGPLGILDDVLNTERPARLWFLAELVEHSSFWTGHGYLSLHQPLQIGDRVIQRISNRVGDHVEVDLTNTGISAVRVLSRTGDEKCLKFELTQEYQLDGSVFAHVLDAIFPQLATEGSDTRTYSDTLRREVVGVGAVKTVLALDYLLSDESVTRFQHAFRCVFILEDQDTWGDAPARKVG